VSLVEKALRKMQGVPGPVAERPATPRRAAESTPEFGRAAASAPAAAPSNSTTAPSAQHRTDVVVNINHAHLRSRGLLPYPEYERRLAAEYRQIKRPLMAIARGKGGVGTPNCRLIMIASALPGEGKTFTSINLALSMALEKDTSVLLMDGDIAKRHISRTFEVQDEPGLMDLLLDDSRDTASVILPTSERGLFVLPAGRDSATATEFLASSRMENIVAELLSRDPNRIVLFDSPPLLLTTESRALTSIAGQIVVVVRAEETTHKAVQDALACIGDGKSVGLVLNQCQVSATQFYYGYGEYGRSSDAGSDRS
jgi:exopolysaccharide/PEP-CTERM locus tyrosine autokinase